MRMEITRLKFHCVYKDHETKYNESSSIDDWQKLCHVEVKKGAMLLVKPKDEEIKCNVYKGEGDHASIPVVENTLLRSSDFMFGIMTSTNQKMLRRYGKMIIIEVVANRRKSGSLSALFLDVIGKTGNRVHVGVCLTNSTVENVFRVFFHQVSVYCGTLFTHIVMTNDEGHLFKDWNEVFGQRHDIVYFKSPWYTLSKFDQVVKTSTGMSEENQAYLSSTFNTLLTSDNVKTFSEELDNLLKFLNSALDARRVMNYVSSSLLLNREEWSICHLKSSNYKTLVSQSIATWNNRGLRRFYGFTRRELGRCAYLIMQYLRGKDRRYASDCELAPGKKSLVTTVEPSLEKRSLTNPEDLSRVAYLKKTCIYAHLWDRVDRETDGKAGETSKTKTEEIAAKAGKIDSKSSKIIVKAGKIGVKADKNAVKAIDIKAKHGKTCAKADSIVGKAVDINAKHGKTGTYTDIIADKAIDINAKHGQTSVRAGKTLGGAGGDSAKFCGSCSKDDKVNKIGIGNLSNPVIAECLRVTLELEKLIENANEEGLDMTMDLLKDILGMFPPDALKDEGIPVGMVCDGETYCTDDTESSSSEDSSDSEDRLSIDLDLYEDTESEDCDFSMKKSKIKENDNENCELKKYSSSINITKIKNNVKSETCVSPSKK